MLGLIFPGQGSQFVGMGKVFYDNFSIVKETFEEGSDALKKDLKKLIFDGPESELTLTHNTQPALLLVSVALYRLLKDLIKNEKCIGAGHSLGEYSALVASGVLKFNEAICAVQKRGEFMQKAVPVGQGGMLAVLGADNDNVLRICQWVEETTKLKPLEPANYNAPGQVVISGNIKAIEWLRENYKGSSLSSEIKAKFIPLNVSAPFHCSMMMPAQKEMEVVLKDMNFATSQFPVVQNVTAQDTDKKEEIRQNLIDQISSPVRWAQSVINIQKNGVQKTIEIGPGRVLSNLVKKIDSSHMTTLNIENIEDFKKLEELF